MLDKNADPFFDKASNTDQDSEKLMRMIDTYDKKMITDIQTGSEITGKVTQINKEFVFLDIGARNEAILKSSEVTDENGTITVKAGDPLSAYVISHSDGETILSKRLSGYNAEKQEIISAYKNRIPVQGKVTGVSKDGLTVKIMGHRAFCPISQIDTKYTENVNTFLGKTLDFIITRVSERGKNIIVSRIPLLEKIIELKLDELENAIDNRTAIKGKITQISKFGLFVDIGNIEGLIHISEISWEHIDNLNELFSIDQEVECLILKIIRKKPIKNSKISLSIKQLLDNPWDSIHDKFSPGQQVQGKLVRLTNFGAFVELVPGVDGLIHVSEMSWVKKIHHPSELLQENATVNATILSIDDSKKSISLSLKDISDDPWHDIENIFPVGNEFSGTIVKKSRYGYFIDLKEGVTGLLVFSNIIDDKKNSFKEGDPIEVRIESIDRENRRISLSHGITAATDNTTETAMKQNTEKENRAGSTEFGAALFDALHKKEKTK